MGYRLGIDVGTTYTAAAILDRGRVETVALGNRAHAIPSAVHLDEDGGVLVGDAALRRGAGDPDGLAREFKRLFGDPTPLFIRGEPVTPEHLTSYLISATAGRVRELQGGPADDVVLTCPAAWGEYRRGLLVAAATEAGVEQVSVVTEPEAAAAYYAAGERLPVGAGVAVYDLGGGTFDATVLRRTSAGFVILGSPEGIDHLGGVDFDEAVFEHVVAEAGLALDTFDADDPAATRALARLRADCTAAKEDLSEQPDTVIAVALPGVNTTVDLTRAGFEAMIRPLVVETIVALERALASADMPADELHAVLLVGGSSRIPLVADLVAGAVGRPLARDTHPKYSVPLGAVSPLLPAPEPAPAPAPVDVAEAGADAPVIVDEPVTDRGRDRRRPPRGSGWWSGPRARMVVGALLITVAAAVAIPLLWPGGTSAGGVEAPDGTMPDVRGDAVATARTALEEQGLLADIEVLPRPEDLGTVLTSEPGEGEPPPGDRIVKLRVSGGEGQPVPEVRGDSLEEALAQLEDFEVAVEFRSASGADDQVVDTAPAPPQLIAPGEQITLTVDTARTELTVPDVTGEPFDEAKDELLRAGFVPTPATVEEPDQPLGTVLGTNPPAGETRALDDRRVTVQVAVRPTPDG